MAIESINSIVKYYLSQDSSGEKMHPLTFHWKKEVTVTPLGP